MADEQQPQTPEAPSSKNPLLLILVVVNIIALGTIAFMQFKFMKMEAARPDLTALLKEKDLPENPEAMDEAKKKETVKKENLLPLETFTVNLAQGEGPRRYVRLDTVLKMSDDAKSEEFEARKPQIRDTIISILNSKRPEDLLKKEGKNYLKEEVKAAINSFLVDGQVVDIFYIGFQIN
jgi:flagellar FliL protein